MCGVEVGVVCVGVGRGGCLLLKNSSFDAVAFGAVKNHCECGQPATTSMFLLLDVECS